MANPVNPYYVWLSREPEELIGREGLLRQLVEGISAPRPRSFQIVGFRNLGASSLLTYLHHIHHKAPNSARRFLHEPYKDSRRFIPVYVDFEPFSGSQSLPAWLWQRLLQNDALQAVRSRLTMDEQRPIAALIDLISAAIDDGLRVVLLLDHFDLALQKLRKEEATQLRPLVGLAAFVTATEEKLVRINQDAASSWFSNLLYAINLEPLKPDEARLLLRQPAPRDSHLDEMEKYLLPLTGGYPRFVLLGAALWWDLRQRPNYANLQPRVFEEIARSRLMEAFRADFVRFWNHISPELRDGLRRLVESANPALRLSVQDELEYRGLIVRCRANRYEPFSHLWSDFILQKIQEHEVAAQAATMRSESPRQLTRSERELLDYLQAHVGQVCTYADILRDVMQHDDTKENRHILRQVIMRLRTRLREMDFAAGDIINHRGRGYEFRPSPASYKTGGDTKVPARGG